MSVSVQESLLDLGGDGPALGPLGSSVARTPLARGAWVDFCPGWLAGSDISFQSMSDKIRRYAAIVLKDPAVDTMGGFTGGGSALNQGRFFVMLKPLEQRGPGPLRLSSSA